MNFDIRLGENLTLEECLTFELLNFFKGVNLSLEIVEALQMSFWVTTGRCNLSQKVKTLGVGVPDVVTLVVSYGQLVCVLENAMVLLFRLVVLMVRL